jgi:hypothetical protein
MYRDLLLFPSGISASRPSLNDEVVVPVAPVGNGPVTGHVKVWKCQQRVWTYRGMASVLSQCSVYYVHTRIMNACTRWHADSVVGLIAVDQFPDR